MSEKALHTPCTSVRPYLKEGSLVHVWIGTPKQSMDAVVSFFDLFYSEAVPVVITVVVYASEVTFWYTAASSSFCQHLI